MFQNAKNTDLGNYCFQPVAIETTSVYGKSTAPFLAALQRNLLCEATPGSGSDPTSACPWLWSEGMLPEY